MFVTKPGILPWPTTSLRMCGRAAAQMGLRDLQVLDSDELAFDDHRPVLPLDARSQMELDLQMVQLQQAKQALLQPSTPDKNITQRPDLTQRRAPLGRASPARD